MLGWPYAVSGKVIHGFGRGRQIGFPTANLTDLGQLLPPPGVYAMRVYGLRPTFNAGTEPNLEVHLLDFYGDLYGLTIELFHFVWLRDEIKFSGVEELKAQLAIDAAQARTFLD